MHFSKKYHPELLFHPETDTIDFLWTDFQGNSYNTAMDGKPTHLVERNGVHFLASPLLEQCPSIQHGFSTRLDGVSRGELSAMNLSFSRGDQEENVIENFIRFSHAIGVSEDSLVFTDQVHGLQIHKARKEDRIDLRSFQKKVCQTDGLITDIPNVTLVCFTADCVPILLADPVKKAIGAIHSGWKGTAGKIGAEAVQAMVREYGSNPQEIRAVVGPSICRTCYEVGKEVADIFYPMWEPFIAASILKELGNGKYLLDLWKANAQILSDSGLLREHIHIASICTCCHSHLLYSHRASKGKRGILAALISLKEEVP